MKNTAIVLCIFFSLFFSWQCRSQEESSSDNTEKNVANSRSYESSDSNPVK